MPPKPRRTPPQRPARPAGGEPKPFLTPGASPFRTAVERRSAAVVIFLRTLPRPVPGLLVLGLVLLALLAEGPTGGVALLAVALLLSWLSFLSWPAVPTVGRAVRAGTIALVLAAAISRLQS